MSTKICTLCRREQSLEYFRRDRTKRDGYHPHCKTCQRQYRRANYHKENSIAKIGERRRHQDYYYKNTSTPPSEKAHWNLKRYYNIDTNARQRRRELIYARDEYFINSKKLNCVNRKGEMFRSQLEVRFSELLLDNKLTYEYEIAVPLINGKRKVVDFRIDNFLWVEISGYAYEGWKQDFDKKLRILRQSIDGPILILTYPDTLQEIQKRNLIGNDIYFDSIDNTQRILRGIKFYKEIINYNYYVSDSKGI